MYLSYIFVCWNSEYATVSVRASVKQSVWSVILNSISTIVCPLHLAAISLYIMLLWLIYVYAS